MFYIYPDHYERKVFIDVSTQIGYLIVGIIRMKILPNVVVSQLFYPLTD